MVNDISIATGIITLFVLLGLALPFINSSFNETVTTNNVTTLENQIGEDINNTTSINAFTVLFSVLKMFFWTFGALPFWLDGIFVILRIILALIIARNIWVGGGA